MKQLFVILAIVSFLCCSGCGTMMYCAGQVQSQETRMQTNERVYGNILAIDCHVWIDNLEHDDDVLPPWLNRGLNCVAVILDVPFSFVFDVVTFPYQLISHLTLWKDVGYLNP